MELTAVNRYMVHSEMCDNWGYGKLHPRGLCLLNNIIFDALGSP